MQLFQPLGLALTMPILAGAPAASNAHAAALNKAFAAAFTKGDAAAVADCYTQDAELLFFKGSTFKGRDAIRNFLVGFFKGTMVKSLIVTSEETHAMGGALLDIGHYEMTTVDKDGKEETSRARYLQVLTKGKDGKWRYFRDCPLPD